MWTAEKKRKQSETIKKVWSKPEIREKISRAIKMGMNRPEIKKKVSLSQSINNNKTERKLQHSNFMKKYLSIPEVYEKYSNVLKDIAKEPEERIRRKNLMLNQAAYVNSFIKSVSAPQVKLYGLTKEIYEDTEINYQFENYLLDVAILSIKVDVEYDGSYWHQNQKHDDKRDKKMNSLGWRVIRYKDCIPTIEQLKRDIEGV